MGANKKWSDDDCSLNIRSVCEKTSDWPLNVVNDTIFEQNDRISKIETQFMLTKLDLIQARVNLSLAIMNVTNYFEMISADLIKYVNFTGIENAYVRHALRNSKDADIMLSDSIKFLRHDLNFYSDQLDSVNESLNELDLRVVNSNVKLDKHSLSLILLDTRLIETNLAIRELRVLIAQLDLKILVYILMVMGSIFLLSSVYAFIWFYYLRMNELYYVHEVKSDDDNTNGNEKNQVKNKEDSISNKTI